MELRAGMGLAERPTDVPLTYCAALGLVDRDLHDDDRVAVTELARHTCGAENRVTSSHQPFAAAELAPPSTARAA
jgi:hypothetical protein